MKLSPNEIAYVASRYWTGPELVKSVAVCLGESGGDTEALGRSTTGTSVGNRDHGLWQISNKWHQLLGDGSPGRLLLAGANWRDPNTNARMAREIYDAAVRAGKDGFSPWSVYTSGTYQTYMPDAEIAVKAPWAPPINAFESLLEQIRVEFRAAASNELTRFNLLTETMKNEVGGSAADLEVSLKAELGEVENSLEGLLKRPHQIVLTSQIQP